MNCKESNKGEQSMQKKNRLLLFVIIYALIFTTFTLRSINRKDKLEVVKIGVMSPSTDLATKYHYLSYLAQNRINDYCNQSNINKRFEFINTNAESDPQKAAEITESLHKEGVNLIVGYGWNTHLNASYNYAMENHMVIVSPSSTSPDFSRSDSCFRLLPDDIREAKALATAIYNYGIDEVIVLQGDRSWGETYASNFLHEYRLEGGNVIEWIIYDPENDQKINTAINRATKTAQRNTLENLGVLIIALEEAPDLLKMAEQTILMNLTWFCTEINTLDPNIIENSGQIASKVTLIGPLNTHIYNEDFFEINKHYMNKFDEPLEVTLANVYDACWLLALSVIEADSQETKEVSKVFGEVAYNHYGITGPLDINNNGDRSWIRYYFYGHYEIYGNLVILRTGRYTRLEKYEQQGFSISQSPLEVIYDNFPYYIWEKQFDSK